MTMKMSICLTDLFCVYFFLITKESPQLSGVFYFCTYEKKAELSNQEIQGQIH